MSGHSHFATIRRKKEATDKKRGQIFSKLAKVITIAAKKGGDPNANPSLRLAIETSKKFNMPKENVDRAIKKGSGEDASERLEEIVFEAYGPGGIALIIEGITDNKNRSLGEIKQILNQYQGKLAGEGSVRWMFERKGVVVINTQNPMPNDQIKEELELKAIEAGADDVSWEGEMLEVYTKPEDLDLVKKNLENGKLTIESSALGWVPKETIAISDNEKETCQKLFEALDDNDSVQEIYSNLKS